MASPDRDEREQVDLAQIVKRLKENMAATLEYEEVRAKIARKRYNELRNVGFTASEAIDIVKGSF